MAVSRFLTSQYSSEHFVESCGAVLFDMSRTVKQVCLIQHHGEWLLPKGRRNIGESRHEAALREVQEETGYKCHIHPVPMLTRAPRAEDPEDVPDTARLCTESTEPFMLTIRELSRGTDAKIIWWYVAVVDSDAARTTPGFSAQLLACEEALQRLTFQTDRDVLCNAMAIILEPSHC
ncbi:hypothetical protein BJX64DRAFT_265339 [Aspergillus heterothallicus]